MPESVKLEWFPVESDAKKCPKCGRPDEVYWKVPIKEAVLPYHWVCWGKEKKP